MNFVVLVGRIKEQPVMETTANGLLLCNLVVETLENDNKQSDTFKVTLWKQVADNIKDNANAGDLVAIKGRLKQNNFTKDTGDIIYRPEIVADKVSLINLH